MKLRADADAFRELDRWSAKKSAVPFSLLDAILQLGSEGDWIRAALVGVAQVLRQTIDECAGTAASAKQFSGDVGGWLTLTGFAGDVTAEARRLRCRAVDTMLTAEDLQAAEAVLARVEPTDSPRTGRLREAQGRHEEAAEAFEAAMAPQDALRNWRLAGRWERALPLSGEDETVRADLTWLNDVQAVLERQSSGQAERLTAQERRRLRDILAGASPPPSGRDTVQQGTKRRRPQ